MNRKAILPVVAGVLFLWTPLVMAGLPLAREKWSLGLMGGGQRLYGDPGVKSSTGPGLHFLFLQRFSPQLAVGIDVGYTELDGSKPGVPNFFTELLNLDLLAQFKPVELGPVRPMLNLGLGAFNYQYMNGSRYFDGEFILGAGTEIVVNRQLALQLMANYHLTTGDDLDRVASGGTDSYLALRGGVVWHLGERLFGGGGAVPETPVEVTEGQVGESQVEMQTGGASVEAQIPTGALADSVRQKIRELELRIRDQEQKVETLRRVVEEKREQVARLEQEISSLASRISSGVAGDFEPRYKHALEQYLNHHHEQAIAEFSALIRDFPGHKYVSNCHYWIGEAYFVLGDYQQAIRSFEKVLNYSNSPKLDDALLMLGRANLKLGDTNQASYYLNRLIEEFPDSEYVGKAKRYLASLR